MRRGVIDVFKCPGNPNVVEGKGMDPEVKALSVPRTSRAGGRSESLAGLSLQGMGPDPQWMKEAPLSDSLACFPSPAMAVLSNQTPNPHTQPPPAIHRFIPAPQSPHKQDPPPSSSQPGASQEPKIWILTGPGSYSGSYLITV